MSKQNNINSIIGGGIAGLVTALSFEKLGIPYQLYEQAEKLDPIGSGIWLSPNALQTLEWINPELLNTVIQSGNMLDRIMVANHKLKPISDSNQEFVKEKFGYSTVAIHRGTLQEILLQFSDTNKIHLGKGFKKYSIGKDSTLIIDFEDDTSINSNHLIAADGLRSKVRKQVFPESNIRYTGQTCWRGIANFDLNKDLATMGFTLWGEKLQFGVSKIIKGKVYWFAVKLSNPNEKDDSSEVKQALLKLFTNYTSPVLDLIKNTHENQIIRTDLNDLEPLSSWSKNNIGLIGDAAHAMTPDLGQGGAQAIEDAYYLSHCLKQFDSFENGFNAFYQYRKPKVTKLVKQSRITSKMAITNSFMEGIRNFMLRNYPKKMMQKQMLELYTINKTVANNMYK